ncbi:MAG: cell division protein ZapA [Gemmatimonadota bacterium]|jgi:cell division protein ZapA|nr:hypothetical protein [Gemmatimonadota bacterium]MDP6461054.1 cell division protein ZapA [Gemmatimonadota bacterium]MDP6529997.1 cell division protein ZapA [Gemmatimonadota bacterium]MDP6802098.1 cell division protein ZapA [Gemmatimonadota bacterium]MDP7032644.1 cell division protein ZapA [Gemmatimonadota bacterium]
MSSAVQTTVVTILGRDYKIRSEDDPDTVRAIARYLDEEMTRVSSMISKGTTTQVAVLAALNITEELFAAQRNGRGLPSGTEKRLRGIVSRLEDALDAEPPPAGKKPRKKTPAARAAS